MVILALNYYKEAKSHLDEISYHEFLQAVQNGEVESVEIKGENITGKYNAEGSYKKATKFKTFGPKDQEELVKDLEENKVSFGFEPDEPAPIWPFLTTWLPILLFLGLFIFFMRQIQSGGGKGDLWFF